MDELHKAFLELFGERFGGEVPDDHSVVFGPDNKYGLESMDTMRFASALMPHFGDKVYDLKVEDFSTLRSVHDQLQHV
ncbi:hypothetical protein AB0G60_26875 [Streptomyces angustmyceticus]|uniref:Carrier domain-containing protein n=1 Tax=Streptomyces angustmyceticus TaxID=285578 RepID=A0A5J4LNS1_9ACTN|nr:hypothetical protein [Streptomyces angustmyceticus]UAL66017.1 hypothetical protein K7396_05225 [Streptomyces angustmyceticus]GES33671.1 hypothetical protein San01_61590 [Streptomyces angustmyceticus]